MFGRKETITSFLKDVDHLLDNDNTEWADDLEVVLNAMQGMRAIIGKFPAFETQKIFDELKKEQEND